MGNKPTIHRGSGNVFADLGLPDANLRLTKAELARVIEHLIAKRGLAPAAAAKAMGLTQSEVSDLVRGRLARVTLESLVKCLIRMGMQISIQVAPPANGETRPGTVVRYAYD